MACSCRSSSPGVALGDADAAHAERGVGLFGMAGELQWLVGPGVERPDHHLVPRKRLEHFGVDAGLLVDARLGVTVEEAQFGAEQPDALGRGFAGGAGGRTVLDVREDRHGVPVCGGAGTRPMCCPFGLAPRRRDGLACGGVIGRHRDGAQGAVD
jgi:hypothetical protein